MSKRFATLLVGGRRNGRATKRRRARWPATILAGFRKKPGLLLAGGVGLGLVLGIALTVASLRSGPRQTHAAAVSPPSAVVAAAAPAPRPVAKTPTPRPRLDTATTQAPATAPAAVGRQAWQQYALAVPATGDRPIIAIVIDDMGLDKRDSARVIGLPGPLTIAFMTYATELERQAAAARAAGHEIWLHVPMEPLDGELDPGPNTLKTELTPAENLRRLDWDLSRLQGYVGINNHMGSRFSSSEPAMRLVLEEVKARGLAFLDSRTTAATVAGRLAGELGVPHVDRDVFIDNDETVQAVMEQLLRAERIAERRGYALAIGHPHATTIAALAQWLPTLKAKGLILVPASALIRRSEAASAG